MIGIFAKRLKEARMSKGWSQTDLARKMETAPQNIQRWESNDIIPRSKTLERLSDLLDKPIDWLMGISTNQKTDHADKTEKKENTKIVKELVQNYLLNDALFQSFLVVPPGENATEIHFLKNQITNLTLITNRLAFVINQSIIQVRIRLISELAYRLSANGYYNVKPTYSNAGSDLAVDGLLIKIIDPTWPDAGLDLLSLFPLCKLFALPYFQGQSLDYFIIPRTTFSNTEPISSAAISHQQDRYLLADHLDITPYFENYQLKQYQALTGAT